MAGLDHCGTFMDVLHVRRLLHRPVAGAPAAAAWPVGASGPQGQLASHNDQAAVDRLVDRLGADMPRPASWPSSPQPSADLRRRPLPLELAGDHGSELVVGSESMLFRASPAFVGLVVREPGLVAAVR